MALSVVDLYRDVLPKTNCGDCGFPTCLAFAGMVVSDKHPLSGCPYLTAEVIAKCNLDLDQQYSEGKWTKRDMAEDALKWAKERSASMELKDLPDRIGGKLAETDSGLVLELAYFTGHVLIASDDIVRSDGTPLTRWEKVFIYNHMAQGGTKTPTGNWKGFEEFPNTVSKVKSMSGQVENPLVDRFHGQIDELKSAAIRIGGKVMTGSTNNADVAIYITPLPRSHCFCCFGTRISSTVSVQRQSSCSMNRPRIIWILNQWFFWGNGCVNCCVTRRSKYERIQMSCLWMQEVLCEKPGRRLRYL